MNPFDFGVGMGMLFILQVFIPTHPMSGSIILFFVYLLLNAM